jgi:hypothetical protein
MGERKGEYRVWVGRPEGKRPLEELDVDRIIIILMLSLYERRWGAWFGMIWLSTGIGGGLLRMR